MGAETETVTVTKYVLTLTDAEVSAALVDPTALQQALRDARGESTPRKNGYGRHYPKPKKEKPARVPKARAAATGAFTKEPCAKCGKSISRSQMHNHLRGCRGSAAAGSD